MDLSVVDLSPVPTDGTASDAYANTVEAAQQAEQLGYSRFWVAEHHGMADTIAGTTPEVLLGNLAAGTDSIRLGSGAVLLNHYSPFKVAEQFGVLDALAPGRIDAGLGRANGSPAADRALGTDRYVQNPDSDHAEKIEAVVNHRYKEEAHGFSRGRNPTIYSTNHER
jgi:luciferase family oxidoreductase group 1